MALVNAGLPLDIADAMDFVEGASWLIARRELRTNDTFDHDNGVWIEATA